MKELEAENARLKKMYIEEKLKAKILNEAISPTWDGPTDSIWVPDIDQTGRHIFSVSETCYCYQAKNSVENEQITNWPIRLTDNNRSWSFSFGNCIYLMLSTINGTINGSTGFTGS